MYKDENTTHYVSRTEGTGDTTGMTRTTSDTSGQQVGRSSIPLRQGRGKQGEDHAGHRTLLGQDIPPLPAHREERPRGDRGGLEFHREMTKRKAYEYKVEYIEPYAFSFGIILFLFTQIIIFYLRLCSIKTVPYSPFLFPLHSFPSGLSPKGSLELVQSYR